MDYSKVGTKLFNAVVKNELAVGRNIGNNSVPVRLSQNVLKNCDSILTSSSGSVYRIVEGQPLNRSASLLDSLGNLTHRFQGLYRYMSNSNPAKAEEYFNKLKMGGLYKTFKEHGTDGLYTYFLNQKAAGASNDSLTKLSNLLKQEWKNNGIETPGVDIWLKGIINKNDFTFLPWKQRGFQLPKESTFPVYTPEARKITESYKSSHRIDSRIPDGFRDGGRSLSFDKNGNIDDYFQAPYREILFVDRKSDKGLNPIIDNFKSILKRNPFLSEEEKVKSLYVYVNELFGAKAPQNFDWNFASVPTKIGSIVASGSGCCRHKSLIAKVLADEIGMNMSIVRGKINSRPDHYGNHIWNEVRLGNGKKYIFDGAQGKLFDTKSANPFMDKYYDTNKIKMY